MTRIPLFFYLEEKIILIVGGGRSAFIKLQTMLSFTENIVMVAPKFQSDVLELAREHRVLLHNRIFLPTDLTGAGLVFAAASREINISVHEESKKAGILCCKAEGGGDFILPACKNKGDLTVAVSTNGKFPMLAKKMCQEMDLTVAEKLDMLGDCRRWVLEHYPDRTKARIVLSEIADCTDNTVKLAKLLERIGYEKH